MNETTSVGSTSEARELPDEILRDATFTLVTTGDGRHATSVTGWQSLIDLFRGEMWSGGDITGAEEEWEGYLEMLHDPIHWRKDDQGPWHFHVGFEDGDLIIYRHWIGNPV